MDFGRNGSANPSLLPPLTSVGILEEATSQAAGKSPRMPQTQKGMMGLLPPMRLKHPNFHGETWGHAIKLPSPQQTLSLSSTPHEALLSCGSGRLWALLWVDPGLWVLTNMG